jgi:hypothetical protein
MHQVRTHSPNSQKNPDQQTLGAAAAIEAGACTQWIETRAEQDPNVTRLTGCNSTTMVPATRTPGRMGV